MKIELKQEAINKLSSNSLGSDFIRLCFLYKTANNYYNHSGIEAQEAILSILTQIYPQCIDMIESDKPLRTCDLIKRLLKNIAENYPHDVYPTSIKCSFDTNGYLMNDDFRDLYLSFNRFISFPVWETYSGFEAPKTGGYDFERAISAYRRDIFKDGAGVEKRFDLMMGANTDKSVYYFGENKTPLLKSDFVHCFYSAYAYWLLSTQPTIIDIIVNADGFEIIFDLKAMIINDEILYILLNIVILSGNIDNLSIENILYFGLFKDDCLFRQSGVEFNQKINLFK